MSTLNDSEIRSRIYTGDLVLESALGQIGAACYELRIGPIYYDLTEEGKRLDATAHGNVLIKPGHRVVLITHERLSIPTDMVARVFSKGSFFSVGLSPVCTYADPGFSGNIGLVTQNLSDKYIVIPLLEPIAKVDFTKLSGPASNPYCGQHGFQSQIWPIKTQLQKTHAQVASDSRVESEEAESYKIMPPAIAKLVQSLQKKQRRVDVAIIIALCINTLTLAFAIGKPDSVMTAVIVNIISSTLIGAFMWCTRLKPKL